MLCLLLLAIEACIDIDYTTVNYLWVGVKTLTVRQLLHSHNALQ